MMKTGIDVVEISRISGMPRLAAFVKRVFTKEEAAYFEKKGQNRFESIAGHFAAKEAFSKYMGSGMRGFSWKDITVCHDEMDKPYLKFMGHRIAADLSISHSKTVAVAVVCGEEDALGGANAEQIKAYCTLMPKRFDTMHKGDCGSVLIVAGSKGMTGAAALCATAALRCGSGLVTVGTPKSEQPILAVKLTEAMTLPLPDRDGVLSPAFLPVVLKKLEKSDVCALGPGLGAAEELWQSIGTLLATKKKTVLDADGLNALAGHINILEEPHGDVVLTPHPGEMARLCGVSVSEIAKARETIAADFARRYRVTLLLKGKNTVIASPRGEIHRNPTGNSGMATGGMGDVLTGVIASLMGQGLDGYNAAVLGAFIHGLSGDLAAAEIGAFGMLAGDVADRIARAMALLHRFEP